MTDRPATAGELAPLLALLTPLIEAIALGRQVHMDRSTRIACVTTAPMERCCVQ
jgi:hypothetical protein